MSYLTNLKAATNYGYTENGAVVHKSTGSKLLDLFGLGGAYRGKSDEDCIVLFKQAYAENPLYALKCLFYLRDVRGGQGERRFFRVCINWLAKNYPEVVKNNLENIPYYGRWDDLYSLIDTPIEKDMFAFIRKQLNLDIESKTPSLLGKWLKSENTSSAESRYLAHLTRIALRANHKQYRKMLSVLRGRINIVERLMSQNKWDEIEFDKIPSRAGLIYKNAFARRDIIKEKYQTFAKDTTTKVNAEVLNPVDIAEKIFKYSCWNTPDANSTERLMLQKYWDNLKDYYNGREENGLAIVDTSGSMNGQPLAAAVSMGAYIAERGKGPFANHFITFSAKPELVEFDGVDITDKFVRAKSANWDMNTNMEAVFDLLLNTAIKNNTSPKDMPETLYIFSDMQFDRCMTTGKKIETSYFWWADEYEKIAEPETFFETIAKKWASYGYELPRIIFWNLRASKNNIPALGNRFSYVSGFNMNMIEQILSGEDGYSLMIKKLDTERYNRVSL